MEKIPPPSLNRKVLNKYSNKDSQFHELYDRYAPAFYGEIRRNLFEQNICNQTLIDSFKKICEHMAEFDEARESGFLWCFRIVRKEIHKKKVNLLLKEIFACQTYAGKMVL